jgi:hypothetical protein
VQSQQILALHIHAPPKHHCHVSRPLPHQQPSCHISTSAMSVAICHVSNCHATSAAFYHVSIIEMLVDLYHVSNHRAMLVVIMPHQHLRDVSSLLPHQHHCNVSRPLPRQQPSCHISTFATLVAIYHVINHRAMSTSLPC